MPDLAPLTCTPTPDGAGVMLARADWAHRIDTAALPSWITLYRDLRDRQSGKYAHIYAQPTTALETAATQAGLRLPAQKGQKK